ncbi:mucin-19-like isoform X2 [Musca vetustissima]|uniref:mucin-19-like isoform X2 n=1 Tax=Musca vetustissima TaxID=27455 RepID=UPI002AB5E413|nr:mucin-19-like isoform X2 [Musca vetustissima]
MFSLSIKSICHSLNGYKKGATLVEEEDFNELTAVPTTTTHIVIAAAADSSSSPSEPNSKTSRHLPPLKLKQSINSAVISAQGPCSTIAASVRNVLQRQQASTAVSATSPTTTAAPTKSKRSATSTNITPQTSADSQPNETTPLVTPQNPVEDPPAYAANSTTNSTNSPNNSINTTYYQQQATNATTTAAATVASTATNNAGQTTATTYTTYSHNSKTTRSWPVIYRNPHHYDYEALYANAPKGSSQYPAAVVSSSFKQNCYSNQFKQSIVYSSSNEDLSTINEYPADGAVAQGNGGRSSSLIGCGGGYSNNNNNSSSSSSAKYSQQQQPQQQTTCYYFSPSRHNSIYEHPSAVVASSLQYDPHSSSAAALESLRRSNSILLRNSSCSSKIMMHQSNRGGAGGDLDSPTSLNSGMDVTSTVGGTNCCSSCCMGPPPLLFLFVTLLMTTSATAMLCAAIMTDHWEHVKWDRASLERYSNRSNLQLEWIMEDTVAMLKPDKRADHRFRRDNLFLVPMHGGIWTLCIDLPLHEIQELRRHPKFPRSAPTCLNYLAGSMENARGEEQRNDWQHRMQNLSISCSLVCLIILGSAALVGAFGVCQRQISAILITGVMYLLAALFALFTLMIIHFKRQQGRPMLDSDYDGTVDGIVARPGGPAIMAKNLLGARVFLTSWSLDLGWGGVVLCAITSVLWILLSKIMRYNPFSTLMI